MARQCPHGYSDTCIYCERNEAEAEAEAERRYGPAKRDKAGDTIKATRPTPTTTRHIPVSDPTVIGPLLERATLIRGVDVMGGETFDEALAKMRQCFTGIHSDLPNSIRFGWKEASLGRKPPPDDGTYRGARFGYWLFLKHVSEDQLRQVFLDYLAQKA